MRIVDTHDLSEPWAQRAWRADYGLFSGQYTLNTRRNARIRMRKIRREAALERKLEAAESRVRELEHDIDVDDWHAAFVSEQARAAQLETERDEAREQLEQARKWARVWKSAAKWQRLGAVITFK